MSNSEVKNYVFSAQSIWHGEQKTIIIAKHIIVKQMFYPNFKHERAFFSGLCTKKKLKDFSSAGVLLA